MNKVKHYMELWNAIHKKALELNEKEFCEYYHNSETLLNEMDKVWCSFNKEELKMVKDMIDAVENKRWLK